MAGYRKEEFNWRGRQHRFALTEDGYPYPDDPDIPQGLLEDPRFIRFIERRVAEERECRNGAYEYYANKGDQDYAEDGV